MAAPSAPASAPMCDSMRFLLHSAGGAFGTGAGWENGRMEPTELRELLSSEGLRLLDSLPAFDQTADVVR